jgi:hypothetical protein
MPKKKHKQSPQARQKILEAQQRNDYLRKIGFFLKAVTGEDVLGLLPQSEIDTLYKIRVTHVGVEADDGCEVGTGIKEGIKSVVNRWLKQREKTIAKTGNKVSLSDYFFFGFVLNICYLDADKYKNAERVRELLAEEFEDLEKVFDCFFDEVYDNIYMYLIMQLNDYTKKYYSFNLEIKQSDDPGRAKYVIKIRTYPAEKTHLMLNGSKHLAYRVGWTFQQNSFRWLSVTPAQLGIESAFGNLPIPVYIQVHALNRLKERAGCIQFAFLNYSSWISLENPTLIRDGDHYLIEFHVGVKIGYFVASFFEAKLVIRTFLFLTCKGAPEGKRLEKVIGLQMDDSKYLRMDKLSTFMSPMINHNRELYAIFEKADCLHLLKLSEELKAFVKNTNENSPLELIAQYLKTDESAINEWIEEEG